MQNDLSQLVNEASSANKAVYEALGQLGEAHAQTWEKLINAQLDLAGVFVEGSSKQLKLFSEAKDVREVLAAQSKLTEEYGHRVVQNARQTLAIIAGARDAYTAWLEQGVDNATETLKRNATKRAA
jgi:phasin family protein